MFAPVPAGGWAKIVPGKRIAVRFVLSSLRFRLLLLVLLAVVPALVSMLNTAAEWRRHEGAEAKASALHIVRHAAAIHERSIQGAHELLVSLAQLPAVRRGDPAGCTEVFFSLMGPHSRYANLGAIKPDGELLCSALATREAIDAGRRAYFRRALETRAFAIGEYRIGRTTGEATVNFAYPVLDEAGPVRAVVYAALDVAWLGELAAEARLPEGTAVTLLDADGTILARHPDPEKWVGKSALGAPTFRAILRGPREGTAEGTGVDGVPRLLAFKPLSGPSQAGTLYFAAGIPTAVAYAESNRILARNLIGLGLAAALAFTAAWIGGDLFLVRRVKALATAAERLGGGDLSARTGVAHEPGEIGQLAGAFDAMASALQARQAEADRAEAGLRRAHQELEQRVQERTVELAKANDALGESRAQLSGMIESAMDAIISIDADQRIVLFNAAAEAMFRCSAAEAMGQRIDRFIPERLRGVFQEHLRALGETGGTGRQIGRLCPVMGLRADGQEFPMEAAVSENEAGGRGLYTAILRDITARQRAEEELRDSRERLRHLAFHLEAAREAERSRVAREIHDELGQGLTVLKLDLSRLAARLPKEQRALREQAGLLLALVDANIQWVRQISTELRPGMLDDLGLVAALEWLAGEFSTRTGIACRFTSDLEHVDANPEVCTAVFRICQEALTNVACHARATRVEIRLEADRGNVVLALQDNGRGITDSEVAGGKSLGLLGMRERGYLLGGEVTFAGSPGEGTSVTVRLPLKGRS